MCMCIYIYIYVYTALYNDVCINILYRYIYIYIYSMVLSYAAHRVLKKACPKLKVSETKEFSKSFRRAQVWLGVFAGFFPFVLCGFVWHKLALVHPQCLVCDLCSLHICATAWVFTCFSFCSGRFPRGLVPLDLAMFLSPCSSNSLAIACNCAFFQWFRRGPKSHGIMMKVNIQRLSGTIWNKGLVSRLDASSTAQGGGGSFKNRKPIGRVGCCDSRMAERIHWWPERWLELCFLEWLQWLQWSPCWM